MKRKTIALISIALIVLGSALNALSKADSTWNTIGALIAACSFCSLIVLLIKSIIDARKQKLRSKQAVAPINGNSEAPIYNQPSKDLSAFHQHRYNWSEWQHIEGSVSPSHYRYGTCSCGETKREQSNCIISITDVRNATETENGYKVYSCLVCGFQFRELIPMRSAGRPFFASTVRNGIYSERLSTGGEVRITETGWSINYYFPGPDQRYNGTFFSIDGKDIDYYRKAWINNFDRYKTMKADIPYGASFEQIGEMGMTIVVGGYLDGVYLKRYHMRVRTDDMISLIVSDYDYAEALARETMEEWSKNP